MEKISSQDRATLIRLAASLPANSKERRDVLSLLKVSAAPDYLPKSGLLPFKQIVELIEEAPEGPMKRGIRDHAKEMQYSAQQFFGRGERFKPQSENVLNDANSIMSLLSHLNHPKERELKKLLKGVVEDFTPIVKSLKS